jgi:hypothetical protein
VCENPYTREDLNNIIKELLDITEIPFQIQRQIRDYVARGYTYKGIARALCFLVDERHFNLKASYKQYGIGIVKNVYQDAQTFYEQLKIEKEKQQKRQQEIIVAANNNSLIIYCGKADINKKIKKKNIDISKL